MKEKNVKVAALVSGGFHTEGLSQLMRQNRVSHLVIMPKFNAGSEGDERPYATIITQKGSYLDAAHRRDAQMQTIAMMIASSMKNGLRFDEAKRLYIQSYIQRLESQGISFGKDVESQDFIRNARESATSGVQYQISFPKNNGLHVDKQSIALEELNRIYALNQLDRFEARQVETLDMLRNIKETLVGKSDNRISRVIENAHAEFIQDIDKKKNDLMIQNKWREEWERTYTSHLRKRGIRISDDLSDSEKSELDQSIAAATELIAEYVEAKLNLSSDERSQIASSSERLSYETVASGSPFHDGLSPLSVAVTAQLATPQGVDPNGKLINGSPLRISLPVLPPDFGAELSQPVSIQSQPEKTFETPSSVKEKQLKELRRTRDSNLKLAQGVLNRYRSAKAANRDLRRLRPAVQAVAAARLANLEAGDSDDEISRTESELAEVVLVPIRERIIPDLSFQMDTLTAKNPAERDFDSAQSLLEEGMQLIEPFGDFVGRSAEARELTIFSTRLRELRDETSAAISVPAETQEVVSEETQPEVAPVTAEKQAQPTQKTEEVKKPSIFSRFFGSAWSGVQYLAFKSFLNIAGIGGGFTAKFVNNQARKAILKRFKGVAPEEVLGQLDLMLKSQGQVIEGLADGTENSLEIDWRDLYNRVMELDAQSYRDKYYRIHKDPVTKGGWTAFQEFREMAREKYLSLEKKTALNWIGFAWNYTLGAGLHLMDSFVLGHFISSFKYDYFGESAKSHLTNNEIMQELVTATDIKKNDQKRLKNSKTLIAIESSLR
ncbi:MAG: hypothetical protein KC649_05015, partial [Candidatus Omnitrophica bacterium]|nr:hypothetical protein [Candidatus Omnitrophota bacterium]